MDDFSILIGGKAGFGIDKAGSIIGGLLNSLGYRIFVYRDYPSLIRGGHTFSIIRASKTRIAAHRDRVDLVIALNEETLGLHRKRLNKDCLFLFDSDQVKSVPAQVCGIGLGMGKILKEEDAPEIMRNTCMIGAMAKALGIGFGALEAVLRNEIAKDAGLNIKVARRGFDASSELIKTDTLKQKGLPLRSGNEAVALGLIKSGLDAYIAYPMTPSSPILHYLAEVAGENHLDVIHPESEIAVILMALGFSYAGKKAAVGTSGGGFCLMTEGLSLSGMAELPVVIVLGQRPGPSTGLPTYSAQTELSFALNAGQGEFVRFVVAPGDAEEAYYWSAVAMDMSWKHRIPAIILTDKHMGESVFDFDITVAGDVKETAYPRAFPPVKGVVIKANSYEHDEAGITTEDPAVTKLMQDKRLGKERYLSEDIDKLEAVKVYGNKDSKTAILCWGSNKGVCAEVAAKKGFRVVQPVVMDPFPVGRFRKALAGVERVISVENNATGQLARLIRNHGFGVDGAISRYDGRPFSLEELEEKLISK